MKSRDKKRGSQKSNEYERPPNIIRPPELDNVTAAGKLEDQDRKQGRPFPIKIKQFSKDYSIIVLTFFIALAAWAQFWVTRRQLTSMNNQLAEIRSSGKQTDKLLSLYQQQATSSSNQAEAITSANRAWIVITTTAFAYLKDINGIDRVSSTVRISNIGPSPAFNVQLWRCAQVQTSEPAVDIKLNKVDCIEEKLGSIGRDVPVLMHMTDLSQTVRPNSLSDDTHAYDAKHFYAWGRLTYYTYLKDRPHYSTFCFLNSGHALTFCQNGNDLD